MIRRYALASMLCLLFGCAATPEGRRQVVLVSDAELNRMGQTAFAQMQANDKLTTVPAKTRYVQCLVDALVAELPTEWRGLPWEAQAFAVKEPNAFALPGGKIGVNTGLLRVATTPDQLAAVIGHEIGHVMYRHAGERVSQQQLAQTGISLAGAYAGRHASPQAVNGLMAALGAGAQVGVLLPFSRKHETEADRAGQKLMAQAGFDPQAAVTLWQAMQAATGSQGGPPQLLSTHPDPAGRIRALQESVPGLQATYQAARAAGKRPRCRDE